MASDPIVGNSRAWVSTARGGHLAGRKAEGTEPELLLRRALHAAGARFRLHRKLAKGCTPDLVLPGRRVAVFVDGDYWHGCPRHFPTRMVSGPNASLWEKKFAATKARDERATVVAAEAGWSVVRVWECEVREAHEAVAARVLSASRSSNT